MAKRTTCAGGSIPEVRIAFEKQACLSSKGEQLRTPKEIAEFIGRHWGCKPQEYFVALYFNNANIPMAVHEISVGGVGQTAVDPKVFFAGALTSGAAAIIIAHNHPSGNVEPSDMDLQLTRHLVEGARLLSLQILDHIIVGRNGAYTSFLERGLMPRPGRLGDEEIRYPGGR